LAIEVGHRSIGLDQWGLFRQAEIRTRLSWLAPLLDSQQHPLVLIMSVFIDLIFFQVI
jgi:hypothetical protein